MSIFSHNEDLRTTFSPLPTETWFRRLCSPRSRLRDDGLGAEVNLGVGGALVGSLQKKGKEGTGRRHKGAATPTGKLEQEWPRAWAPSGEGVELVCVSIWDAGCRQRGVTLTKKALTPADGNSLRETLASSLPRS